MSALLFIAFQINVMAQTPLIINGDFTKNTLVINNVSFTKTSTIEDYENVLGKADIIDKVAGRDKVFGYNKLGIMLILRYNANTVQEIYINYTYEEDKKEVKDFKGKLSLNGIEVTDKSTLEEIAKNTGLKLEMPEKEFYIAKGKSLSLSFDYIDATIGVFLFTFD